MSSPGGNYSTDQTPPPADMESKAASKRWAEMQPERESYLIRARRLSKLTIPSLFRESGDNGTTDTPQAWQSFGAYCVNNLSSKLTLTIMPPGICPIRLDPSRQTIQDLIKLGTDEEKRGELKIQIGKGLRAAENEFTSCITQDRDSVVLAKGVRYEIVGGTHGYQMYTDGTWRGIPLDRFMCLRDGQGNLLEFLVEDVLVWDTLPKVVREYLKNVRPNERDPQTGKEHPCKTVKLYTHGYLNEDGKYEVYQECLDYKIPDTEWTWAKEYLPFIFVPFNLLPGESYGRSYCEDYESDLQSLDGNTEILTEGTSAAGLLIRTVKPGGVTSKEALAKARNGAVITGDLNDIGTVPANKQADFQMLANRIDATERRLAQAFLLNNAVQREAERVTAEEVRFVAQELNEQLGSLYLDKVGTFQAPWARLKMAAMMRTKRMTPLPPHQVQVQMATGAAALSRNAELQVLDMLTMPPNPVMQQLAGRVIDPLIYYQRRAISLGADQDGLIKTQAQLAEEDAQAAQQAQMAAATPNLVKAGGDLIGKGIDHNSNMAQIAQEQAGQQQPQQGTPAQ